MKINVVGISGAGKSTFAKALADKLSSSYIEMDSLYWKEDWQPNDNFLEDLSSKLSEYSSYVLDGNYASSDHLKWKEIDLIIWLDYSFSRSFYRCFIRTLKRVLFKETLWGSNKESFSNVFLTKNSILYFMMTHYHKNKIKFEEDMKKSDKFIRLKTPKEAEEFLNSFNSGLFNDT